MILYLEEFKKQRVEIEQSYITKVIYLFGKPRSVVLMPEKLKGGVACLYCARPLKMAILLHTVAN